MSTWKLTWRSPFGTGTFEHLEERLGKVEERLGERLGWVGERLGRVEEGMGRLEERVGGVENRLGRVEEGMGRVHVEEAVRNEGGRPARGGRGQGPYKERLWGGGAGGLGLGLLLFRLAWEPINWVGP